MGNAPSPMRNAVRWNDVAEVDRILKKAGPNAADVVNRDYSQDCIMQSCIRADGNALYNAVSQNRLEIVRLMIQHNADVHTTGRYGETCLHRAASNNNLEMAKLLLQAGSDVMTTDDQGHYIIHACGRTRFDTSDVIAWLLDEVVKKDHVNIRDFSGRTALHEAVAWGNYAACKKLIEYGADVNAISNHGNTPLHSPVGHNPAVWNLMVEHGADVSAVNNEGHKPRAPAGSVNYGGGN